MLGRALYIATLSRFLARLAEKSTLIFQTLEEASRLQMDGRSERAFQDLNKFLVEPLVLSKPKDEKPLYIYLSVTEKAISSIL